MDNDFNLAFPDEKINEWLLWKILKLLSLSPDYYFILIINPNESIKRSQLKNEPFPDDFDVLTKRLKCYKKFAIQNVNYKLINCEKSINEINREIKSFVF